MNDEVEFINKHLETYINYYKSLNAPGYAILVNGEWGIGKTYLVNSILKDEEKCYVSLFGLTSIQEIHTELFVKMYPGKARTRKFFNLFGNSSVKANDATLALGPLIGNIANALLKEEVDNSKIIIFDDLERCKINPEDLLGAINKYVEHHKCKVIVIAHDEKLNDTLTDRREKVFGQVIRAYSDAKHAFDHFIKISKAPYAFGKIKNIVYTSFLASECKSLRILNYTVNDCIRLLTCIPSKILDNKELLEELFTLFTALDINFRSGKLDERNLELRNSTYYFSKKESSEIAALEEIIETYKRNKKNLFMESDLLSNQVLIETIANGYYNKGRIEESINNSRHFISQTRKAPWLTVLNFESINTNTVNLALQEIYDGFEKLEITDRGDILHSVNVLFMLSEYNHINLTFEEIYNLYINYAKKLQGENKFPAAALYKDVYGIGDTAHGYGFWIENSYESFSRKMREEFEIQEEISLKKKYPLFLSELATNLKENTQLFCEQISRNIQNESNNFGYISILASFKAYEFVDMWFSTDIEEWHKVRIALVNRYSSGALQSDLKDELVWIKNVKMNIRHRASKVSGIDKLRISRMLMQL